MRTRRPPHRRSAAVGVALAFGVVALIGVASKKMRGAPTSAAQEVAPPIAAPSPTPTPSATSASSASAAWTVLSIRATPLSASIWLDDARVDGNPLSLRLPRDGKPHIVRFEAPGYAKQSQPVVLDDALRSLVVTLNKLEIPVESTSSKPNVASPTAAPAATAKPKLGLDTGDPWKR